MPLVLILLSYFISLANLGMNGKGYKCDGTDGEHGACRNSASSHLGFPKTGLPGLDISIFRCHMLFFYFCTASALFDFVMNLLDLVPLTFKLSDIKLCIVFNAWHVFTHISITNISTFIGSLAHID